jgi:hypothetical protein
MTPSVVGGGGRYGDQRGYVMREIFGTASENADREFI